MVPPSEMPAARSDYFDYLQGLRAFELEAALPWLPARGRILEVGAGAGWQASYMAERGREVIAVDVEDSEYEGARMWPVLLYDGQRLPFAAASFDAIFSSNVLEHVADLDTLQAELLRVLRPDGVAVHVLPSAAFRFWSNVNFYPYAAKLVVSRAVTRICGRRGAARWENPLLTRKYEQRSSIIRKLLRPVPSAHGIRGNCLSELFYFSRLFWVPLFERTGWRLKARFATGLYYAAFSLFTSRMGIGLRRKLSRILGSGCAVYVLAPRAARHEPRGCPGRQPDAPDRPAVRGTDRCPRRGRT